MVNAAAASPKLKTSIAGYLIKYVQCVVNLLLPQLAGFSIGAF